MTHANGLGATSAGTTVASGPGLQISGGITLAAEPLTLSGDGYWGGGALENISGNNTWAGPIKLGAKARIRTGSGTLTVTGTITNGGYQAEFAGGDTIIAGGIIRNFR